MLQMARYFVTQEGLTAALHDERVLKTVTDILTGSADKAVEGDYLRRGLIDVDRRPAPQVDNNLLILSGAVHRMRSLLAEDLAAAEPASATDEDMESVRDLRTIPRKLYRLSAKAGKLTTDDLRALPAGARHVIAALRQSEVGTTKTLAEHTGLNRRTVENALSALRKEGLIDDSDFIR